MSTTTGARARERLLARLDGGDFDVLVVGGGITGLGIARDAALRGLSVALCEAGDFASQTSSHSSKLIHGGLRYLQYGDLGLVFEALTERRVMLRTAPHLCRPIDFLFPAYADLPPRLSVLGMGVMLYNALALYRAPVKSRRLSAAEVFELSPHLRAANLRGAQLYVDCQTDDARLALENALAATDAGAAVASYVIVTELVRDHHDRVIGARARDRASGAPFELRARAVVNATGPFSDSFDRGRHNLRPTLGVHLTFDAARLPHHGHATVLRSPRDGRLVFLLPAGARTMLGTTDTDWTPPDRVGDSPLPSDAIVARARDVEYLLEVANHAFPPLRLDVADVISAEAGLRPLIRSDGKSVSATSREHEILFERDGVVSIVGGKLTTYRSMAEQVVDRTIEVLRDRGLERALAPCSTARTPLPGTARAGEDAAPALGDVELAPDVERHLRETYGIRARSVVATMVAGVPSFDLGARIEPDLPFVWAEIAHAARHELVVDVEDALTRRLPLLRSSRDQGLGVAPRAADLLARELGWSPDRRERSLAGFRDAVARTRAWRAAG